MPLDFPEPNSSSMPPDRLTVGRTMLLTAGVAVGVTLLCPVLEPDDLSQPDRWREVAFSIIAGLTIPAPLFCRRGAARKQRIGPGGLFALSTGLGVWILLPAAVIERVQRVRIPNVDHYEAASCLYYVMPMIGLWFLLGGLVSGHLGRQIFARTTPWIERYGALLALLWTPLGIWHVVDVYAGVL